MKAVNYSPQSKSGTLSTLVGGNLVTLVPGQNILDDHLVTGLKKNCSGEFKTGLLKEVTYKTPKAPKVAPLTQRERFAQKKGAKTAEPVKKLAKKKAKEVAKKVTKKAAKKVTKKVAKKKATIKK